MLYCHTDAQVAIATVSITSTHANGSKRRIRKVYWKLRWKKRFFFKFGLSCWRVMVSCLLVICYIKKLLTLNRFRRNLEYVTMCRFCKECDLTLLLKQHAEPRDKPFFSISIQQDTKQISMTGSIHNSAFRILNYELCILNCSSSSFTFSIWVYTITLFSASTTESNGASISLAASSGVTLYF